MFWVCCEKFIEQRVETAVDNRCHGEVTHLSYAISVRDLLEQVTSMHPPGTPIQWVRVAVLAEKPDSQSKLSAHGKFGCKIYGSSLSDKDVA